MIAPERDFRGPGCDERCVVMTALVPGRFGRSELLLHDWRAHERYGRRQAGGAGSLVVTGPLSLDVDGAGVAVDGRAILLTAVELRMLFALGVRVGQWVASDALAAAIWGPDILAESPSDYRHALRVNMARLRKRLHPAGGLISTYPFVGYRLEVVPPGAAAPSGAAADAKRLDGWAISWAACRVCGLADLPHAGGGRCTSCQGRDTPRPNRGRTAQHMATRAQRALADEMEEAP